MFSRVPLYEFHSHPNLLLSRFQESAHTKRVPVPDHALMAAAVRAADGVSVLRPWAIDHAPVSSDEPLSRRLAINSAYFDTMLSLIPAKYYLKLGDEDEYNAGDSKYHVKKKGSVPGMKADSVKASTKASKKLRFEQGALSVRHAVDVALKTRHVARHLFRPRDVQVFFR